LGLSFEISDGHLEHRDVSPQPRMTHDVPESASLGRIGDEHPEEQVSRLGRDPIREGELSRSDVPIEEVDIVSIRIGGIVVVGKVAREHGVQDHSTGPDVDRASDIRTIVENELRSSVTGRTTGSGHEVVVGIVEPVRKPEIGDNDLPVPVEEEVLELQVPMDDLLLVEVGDAGDELGEELAGHVLPEVLVCEDVLEELAACVERTR